MIGRLITGALWGAGASAVLAVTKRERNGSRPLVRTLMKGYVAAADRVAEVVAEARESLGDLYEEARAEHEQEQRDAESQAAGVQESDTEKRAGAAGA
ncbi:MAG TPA: hypothetical protein VE591_04395 [Candidatus Acidoferrum sp.]|nr:hypothetical protein [Candidatus Acidoferrum sp.]